MFIRWGFPFAFALMALAGLLLETAPARSETVLVMGTGLPGGNYNQFGRLLSQVVNQNAARTGIRIKLHPTEGSVANLKGLSEGRLQLGLAQGDTVRLARLWKEPWQTPGRHRSLRTVYKIYTEAITCVVRADAGINTCNDLRGKRVALGTEGSGTHGNAIRALALCWLKPADLGQALLVNAPEAMRLMYGNKLDAFFYTVGHPNHTLAKFIQHFGQASLLSFKASKAMNQKIPYFIWKSDYPGLQNTTSMVDTFGIRSFLMTSNEVPATAIYEIARLYWSHLGYFKKHLPPMREVDAPTHKSFQDLTWNVGAPFHQGVEKLFREMGIR